VVSVLAAFSLGGTHGATVSHLTTAAAPSGSIAIGSMGLAVVSILWAYDGWGDLSFASGEVKDPQRNLPRAIVLGTLAIIVIYVLTNIAYLYMNPIDAVAKSPLIAADTMSALFGRVGVVLVSIFVMISSFSSLNGSMLASPRVFFAMADDGLFFPAIAKVHPRYRTPASAIVAQAIWSSALVLTATAGALVNYTGFAIVLFSGVAVAALFVLRRREPDAPRPFRAWGYPVAPAIYAIASAAIIVNGLIRAPGPTSAGALIIAAGLPAYFFFTGGRAAAHRDT